MSDRGAPRHGRHSSPDEGWESDAPSWGAGSSFWSDSSWTDEAPAQDGAHSRDDEGIAWHRGPSTAERYYGTAAASGDNSDWTGGPRYASGLLERWPDETGPIQESRHRGFGESGDTGGFGSGPRRDVPTQGARGRAASGEWSGDGSHPSGPLPPLPRSAWSKLPSRPGDGDDTAAVDGPVGDDTEGWDRTGGLEVIGAHVEEEARRRGVFRRRRPRADEVRHDDVHDEVYDDVHDEAYDDVHDEPYDGVHDHDVHEDDLDHDVHGDVHEDEIPIQPYDGRPHRLRKRRKRVALLVSLVVLLGLAGGVVFGGQKLFGLFTSQDYTGVGTGKVQIRVHQGDTLTDIGTTMVDDGVVASVRPFVKAAEANPASTSIAPGLYGLRHHMSGKAALDLLLKPSSRLVSRVTLPEGLTGKQTLQRLADGTGVPIDQLQAAAADPAALGLPAYANGMLEGFLFPATYDFEPGTTPQDMLKAMVARTVQTLDQLGIPADQRLGVLTEASIVQAESGSAADMPKVARVLDNRLADGTPLQLDTTVNYANGKSGVTTTAQDRANPSPYNTYVHTGLPPGAISNPGEDALKAVLHPADGNWKFFVVVNPDTGETRFAATAEEHAANVKLFQQWLQQHPNG